MLKTGASVAPRHLPDAILEATMLSLRTKEGLDMSAATAEAAKLLRAVYEALRPWEERQST